MKAYQIVYYSILIAGIALAILRWKLLSRSSRWSATLLAFTLISELTAHFIGRPDGNFPVYHFFIPVQFALVSSSFFSELQTKFYVVIILLFACFCAVSTLIVQPLHVFPSIINNVGSFIIITFALIYLKKLLEAAESSSFTDYPMFWISFGWLFFNILTLFHFGAYNYFLTSKSELTYSVLRNIKIGSNYLLYGCYTVAFLTPQKSLQN